MAELIWEGKYRDSKRVQPVRLALPFQTVETVNESAADRARTRDLFAKQREGDWRNRLIWGDKKYVLPSLLQEFAGKVDLVYIDPPFNTDSDFSFTVEVPGAGKTIDKRPSIIEHKAYRDTWGAGKDQYLQWFYETTCALRLLMSERATIYVHLDQHVGHYAKVILDEVFGVDNFLNEIVWKRTSARADSSTYNHIHDVIFVYGINDYTFNAQYVPHDPDYVASKYVHVDEGGRKYRLDNITSPNPRPKMTYTWRGHEPPAMGWRYSRETMQRLHNEGRIWYPDSKGKRPQLKRYLDESPGQPITSVWDISPVNSQARDRLNYDTQKPEALLERIIRASSNEGDLVLDCFCGSGTTAAAAEKLGRRWITCDLGRFAVHTARKRLLSIPGVRPFVVQNLGKYERQAWMKAEFLDETENTAREAAYQGFVLSLYKAQPLAGSAWLHGVKDETLVHVGAVDAPVTAADVDAIAKEARARFPKAEKVTVDVLGWEFAFELNEMAKGIAAASRVTVRFKRIPRDLLDKRAVDRGDIKPSDFFELRMLSAKLSAKKGAATLEITDFILPAEDLPEDVRKAVTHWSQWIDYWAVDWAWKGDSFHNEWQSYRSRQEPTLATKATHTYNMPGMYMVMVKVIDILGNDTTRTFSLEVS